MHPAVAWVFCFFLWSHGNPAVLTCLLFADSVREMEQFSGFVVSFLICSWRQNNPAVWEFFLGSLLLGSSPGRSALQSAD